MSEGDRRWPLSWRDIKTMGKPSIFDGLAEGEQPDPWSKWRHMLERGSGLALSDLQRDGTARVLPVPAPGEFYDTQVQTGDGRVDCCPAIFGDAIERSHEFFSDAEAGPTGLLLISRRDAWMQNSWFANVAKMKRGGRTNNPLSMHPADAMTLGLAAGDCIAVTSDHGEIESVIELDDDLMPGVVSMVHGWGHAASPQLRVAHASPGANPNALLPIGPGSFEPLSSQAHMTGIRVRVRALAV